MSDPRHRRFLDPPRRTPEYEAAVAALHKLVNTSPNMLGRACAEVMAPMMESVLSSKLRRTSGVRHPLRLLGRRPGWNAQLPSFSDHTSLWLKDGKPHVWVTQPYDLNNEDIRELAGMAREYEITISGASWHFPGWTVMVALEKKKQKPVNETARNGTTMDNVIQFKPATGERGKPSAPRPDDQEIIKALGMAQAALNPLSGFVRKGNPITRRHLEATRERIDACLVGMTAPAPNRGS